MFSVDVCHESTVLNYRSSTISFSIQLSDFVPGDFSLHKSTSFVKMTSQKRTVIVKWTPDRLKFVEDDGIENRVSFSITKTEFVMKSLKEALASWSEALTLI